VERNWKASTFISYQRTLSVFFQWCVAQNYIAENPIVDLEAPRLERKLPRGLSKEDVNRILESVYNYPYENNFIRLRNHAIFSTFPFAGLRKQEILQLRYADVDLNSMSIFINNSKGNKDRIIPISPALRTSLEKIFSRKKKEKYYLRLIFRFKHSKQRYFRYNT